MKKSSALQLKDISGLLRNRTIRKNFLENGSLIVVGVLDRWGSA